MDERLCVNPGHGCFHTWLVGHGRREMESKARMPPWQLVPEPLNHTLTLQSCSQTKKSRRLVGKQRTRRAGCRERMWEISRGLEDQTRGHSHGGVWTQWRVSAELLCCSFLHLQNEQLSLPVISGTRTTDFPEFLINKYRWSPGQKSGEGITG